MLRPDTDETLSVGTEIRNRFSRAMASFATGVYDLDEVIFETITLVYQPNQLPNSFQYSLVESSASTHTCFDSREYSSLAGNANPISNVAVVMLTYNYPAEVHNSTIDFCNVEGSLFCLGDTKCYK